MSLDYYGLLVEGGSETTATFHSYNCLMNSVALCNTSIVGE